MARTELYYSVAHASGLHFKTAGVQYVVATVADPNVHYAFLIDPSNAKLFYIKTIDNQITWSSPILLFNNTINAFACCYDRWSGIAGGLIHCAVANIDNGDIEYRTIDTENSDALSTTKQVAALVSTANGGWLSIIRARGGDVYIKGCIDAGVEGGFYKLLNANVPNGVWEAPLTDTEALATTDQAILVPGFAADTNDIMCMFIDASANELSRYVYDSSANTWSETLITAITDTVATTSFPHFSACVDLANSQILLIAWNNVDVLNADLLSWSITESAITPLADVISNSTDDQGFAALGIDLDTGYIYAVYGGVTGGTETFPTAINLYYKISTDSMATWGTETKLTTMNAISIEWICMTPRFNGIDSLVVVYSQLLKSRWIRLNVELPASGGGMLVHPGMTGGIRG